MIVVRLFYRIFTKLTTISMAAKKYYDMGKINTIVLMNITEVGFFFMFLPHMFSSPIIILFATIYIIIIVGPVGILGPALLGICSWGL